MESFVNTTNQQATIENFRTASVNFIEELGKFSGEKFNQVPFAGSWTAGQIAEHVLLSCKGIGPALHGASRPPERNPAALIPQLEKIFLDFSTKMKSPDFILPSEGKHDKQQLISLLDEAFSAIAEASASVDLLVTCTEFEFPGMGFLTRLELVHFAYVHTARHTNQLQKLFK